MEPKPCRLGRSSCDFVANGLLSSQLTGEQFCKLFGLTEQQRALCQSKSTRPLHEGTSPNRVPCVLRIFLFLRNVRGNKGIISSHVAFDRASFRPVYDLVRQRVDALCASGKHRAGADNMESCDWLVAAACGVHDILIFPMVSTRTRFGNFVGRHRDEFEVIAQRVRLHSSNCSKVCALNLRA